MNYNRVQLLRTSIDILQRVSNGARLATPARDQSNRFRRSGSQPEPRNSSSPLVFPRAPWLLKLVFRGELLHTHVATAHPLRRCALAAAIGPPTEAFLPAGAAQSNCVARQSRSPFGRFAPLSGHSWMLRSSAQIDPQQPCRPVATTSASEAPRPSAERRRWAQTGHRH